MKVSCIAFRSLVLSGALSFAYAVNGQDLPEAALTSSVAATRLLYDSTSRISLYNGPEYIDYSRRYNVRTGHQYFLSPEKQSGTVLYNDHYFSSLPLAYDVVLDQVVIQHVTSPLSLRLINEKIKHFTLGQHFFTRLVTDSATSAMPTGFYEVLVDSSTVQLVARRAKQIQQKVDQGSVYTQFVPLDRLYLCKAGAYYAIHKKSGLTRQLADHSKEVQQYIQEHKLRFRKTTFEADAVQLTRFYSGLPSQ